MIVLNFHILRFKSLVIFFFWGTEYRISKRAVGWLHIHIFIELLSHPDK
jgi:hypothetical protein